MKMKLQVTGMTCAACSSRVEKVTNAVPGVQKAEVNLLAGTMVVEASGMEVNQEIIRSIQNAGYNAYIPGEKKQEAKEAAPAENALPQAPVKILK